MKKIIILGAGQVGGTLAENLAIEENDITVVDSDHDRLRELRGRLDIRTIEGKASHPSVLKSAGAEDADMIIAVTNSDEVNMIACQVGHSLYKIPKRIARIRHPDYIKSPKLFANDACPVNVLISPEQVVTHHITALIEQPGALQVLDFADGQAQLVAVRAYYGGPLVGQELRYLREHMPSVDTRVAAIFRKGQSINPEGGTVIEADDEVFFIAATKDIRDVMSELRRLDNVYSRIIIAGGGNIGERLAQAIEGRYNVKLIEHNLQRCEYLSQTLDKTLVFHGSASDSDLLNTENIDQTDVFCALTNNDEANIMSAMLAKQLGARKVMALISNPAYADLLQDRDIDIAISPQQATISSLLAHVRRGAVSRVHSLRRGAAEAIEVTANGDKDSSQVVGKTIGELQLPPGTTIGAIVRNKQVLIAHDHIEIKSEDHVILFLVYKEHIREIEKLFHPGLGFF